MKYMGIDFGTKRVGIAVSNQDGTIAFPRDVLISDESLVKRIVELIEKEKVDVVVIGDTRAASSAPNVASLSADLYIEELKEATSVPIHRGFEAWSSVEASRYAPKGRARDDAAAAAIILQRFLDSHANDVL